MTFEQKKKEHPQAKWLRAIADGETLQKQGGIGWVDVPGNSAIEAILKYGDEDWRIKPRTITIGKYEVVEPLREAPECRTHYFYLSAMEGSGVEEAVWLDDGYDVAVIARGMAWLRREDAELAAKAISELLTGTK